MGKLRLKETQTHLQLLLAGASGTEVPILICLGSQAKLLPAQGNCPHPLHVYIHPSQKEAREAPLEEP